MYTLSQKKSKTYSSFVDPFKLLMTFWAFIYTEVLKTVHLFKRITEDDVNLGLILPFFIVGDPIFKLGAVRNRR